MNIKEAEDKIALIKQLSGDPEAAHSEEDQLYHDFIFYIASAHLGEVSRIANTILKTKDIKFVRWCA